ncbi:MAG: hypothetical protein AABZ47_15585 [Planctomycetota bacterium]
MSEPNHFQIGVVHVTLDTAPRRLTREYSSLYAPFATLNPSHKKVRVSVLRTPWSARKRRRFQVCINGRLLYSPTHFCSVLPHVEWAVSWELQHAYPRFFQLHAATLEIDGMGVVFPGQSGVGKSTLSLGLFNRGWNYLCDEFALIDAETLEVHPYPRAICVKEPSFAIAESLGMPLHGGRRYWKGVKGPVGFVQPLSVRSNAIGRACPVRFVIFPQYQEKAEPTLIPMSRAETAFQLHEAAFNRFACHRPAHEILTGLVRGAECFRLITGDLQQTCDLIQNLVRFNGERCARSA